MYGGGFKGYDEMYRRQAPTQEQIAQYTAANAPANTPAAPAPPSEDPGAPPGGGDAGPGGGGGAPAPAPTTPRPPMPRVAPPTAATPVSAGSFVRPGMERAQLAPFRSAPGMMARRAPSAPMFGPGTPLAGGAAVPAPFAGGEGGGEEAGAPSPEELLRILQGGR